MNSENHQVKWARWNRSVAVNAPNFRVVNFPMKFDGIEHQSCENTSGEFSVQSSCKTSGLDRLTETVEVAESGKRCGGAAIESQLANAIKLKFE